VLLFLAREVSATNKSCFSVNSTKITIISIYHYHYRRQFAFNQPNLNTILWHSRIIYGPKQQN